MGQGRCAGRGQCPYLDKIFFEILNKSLIIGMQTLETRPRVINMFSCLTHLRMFLDVFSVFFRG